MTVLGPGLDPAGPVQLSPVQLVRCERSLGLMQRVTRVRLWQVKFVGFSPHRQHCKQT